MGFIILRAIPGSTNPPGTIKLLDLPDGSPHAAKWATTIRRRSKGVSPTAQKRERLFLTGMLYYDASMPAMSDQMSLVAEPLATLPASKLRPSAEALAKVMEQFR